MIRLDEFLERKHIAVTNNSPNLVEISKEVNSFFINLEPRFIRIEEHVNKLYLDNRIENDMIRDEISRYNSKVQRIKIISYMSLIFIVAILVTGNSEQFAAKSGTCKKCGDSEYKAKPSTDVCHNNIVPSCEPHSLEFAVNKLKGAEGSPHPYVILNLKRRRIKVAG